MQCLAGLFGGETIYTSGTYVTPNTVRAERKRKRSSKTVAHVQAKEARRERVNIKGAPRAGRRRVQAARKHAWRKRCHACLPLPERNACPPCAGVDKMPHDPLNKADLFAE